MSTTYQEYIVRVYKDRTEWRNSKGQLHRADGPAIEWTNGTKSWYQNGKRHRLDGPAVEYPDGSKEWYIDGKYLTEQEWKERTTQSANDGNCDGRIIVIDGKKYRLVKE